MTKAEFNRFFNDHDGQMIHTLQTRPDGREWRPGPRRLVVSGRRFFLGEHPGSEVRLTRTHRVVSVTAQDAQITWHDENGALINSTTYSVVL